MRPWANAKLRVASIAVCCVGIALGLAAVGLAFSSQGPTRTLRPILSYADSAYVPLYIGMSAVGLLILGGIVGIVSALSGNRGVDLAVCIVLLAAAGLALGTLALAGGLKGSAQTNLEATLADSLKRFGRDDAAAFDAWNQMQNEMGCCAIRTNKAQPAYEDTPWYKEMRQGSPNPPKVPASCCTKAAQANPVKVTDCTVNRPAVPSVNPDMNKVGCFEAMGATLDAYSSRFIGVGVLAFAGAAAALGVLAYGLIVSARHGGTGGSSGKARSQQFSNSRPGSVAGTMSVAGRQPLMSQPPKAAGSSVYGSRHSLFSEPAPMPRPPSESSLPSLANRSLFSEPPARMAPSAMAIQAQPVKPRQQQQQQQQRPVPKPRSSHAGSLAAPSEMSLGSQGGPHGTLSGVSSHHQSQHELSTTPQPPPPQQPQPPPPPQKLQAQPMRKPQQPIALAAQPLRPQHQAGRGRQPPPQAFRKGI